MRYSLLLIAMLCQSPSGLWAQVLSKSQEEHVQSLLDSSEQLKLRDPAGSLSFALQALDWLPAEGYERMKIFAFLKAANAEKMGSRKESSLDYIQKALRLSESIHDTSMLMRTYFMKASIHGYYDEPDSALYYFQRSIDIYLPGMDLFYPANAYTNIGGILRNMGQEDKAETYYLKGYEMSRKDKYTWIFTLSRLIAFYSARQDPKYFAYLDTFSNSDFVRNGSKASVAAHFYSILNLANASLQQKEDKLREIYDLAGKQSGPIHQVEIGLRLNDVLVEQQKYTASQQLLDALLTLAIRSKNGKAEAEVNQALYATSKALHATEKALAYLERFSFIHDSLHAEEIQKQIQELNVKFEVAQKDHEIERQGLKLEQGRRNRNYLLVVSALLAGLAGVTYVYFHNRIRTARRIREQEETIHTQEKERLKQEKELTRLAASLEAQESERNRIARDLHDGVGSLMSGISAQIENLIAREPENALYPPIKQMVRDTAAELRRTSYELMPANLLRMGLEPAIRDLCLNLIVKNGIKPNFEMDADLARLTPEQQLIVYRIVQELFHNIVKHAKAKHILIQFTNYEDQVTMVIEDDGAGFDMSDKTKQGIGLTSIKSRVDLLSGFLDIASKPGEGTTVTINFPFG